MSIRITALYIFITFLAIYAWKDWFKSLCGLILLMAVIERGDMPKSILGIQGFNLWNLLLIMIFMAWLVNRRREGLIWDMPHHIVVLLLMYLGVILIGVLQAAFDRSHIEWYPLKALISEELINTIKWILPGLLLFDGCRTRRRVILAILCMLAIYFLISIQVLRSIPFHVTLQSSSNIEAMRNRCSRIGYSACDMSAMLAGASWGIIATLTLIRRKKYQVMVLIAASIVVFGQAITGGRAGYLAWGATGFVLCMIRWRKYLILVPVVVILLPIVFPGAVERMLKGINETDIAGQRAIDEYAVTSGRAEVWPYVIAKISKSPLIGYGRLAMRRTGLTDQVTLEGYIGFDQPHNLYLEMLLHNGILGSIPVVLLWGFIIVYSVRLFCSDNCLCSSVGGIALSLILAQMFAGIGSQHIYPEESTLGMWAAMFLSLRVYIEEARQRANSIDAENDRRNCAAVRRRQVVVSSANTWNQFSDYRLQQSVVLYAATNSKTQPK